jgi:hypothetical protein
MLFFPKKWVKSFSSNKFCGNDLAALSEKKNCVLDGHRPSVQQVMQEAGEQELP